LPGGTTAGARRACWLSYAGSVHDVSKHYTWEQAFAHVAALNGMSFAGHADWRLPNVKELQARMADSKRG